MLKIFNMLGPFIEDNYIELGVREYAKIVDISPPTASKTLKRLEEEGILRLREDRRYLLYRADRESKLLLELSKAYWLSKLKDLANHLKEGSNHARLLLFGSLIKLETRSESDIDIYVDAIEKELHLSRYEKQLRRKIQLHFRKSLKNINLKKNIEKGVEL